MSQYVQEGIAIYRDSLKQFVEGYKEGQSDDAVDSMFGRLQQQDSKESHLHRKANDSTV